MKNTKINCHCESNEAIQKTWNNHTKRPVFFKKTGLNSTNQAFTLVELIVVITILAILWTIAFISFQWYSSNARDGVRISDINNIKQNLGIFITEKWFYPLPDNGIQISYSWAIAWTQWTVWDNVTTNLRNLSKKPTDPLSNNEYTYSVANNNVEYQLSYVTEWWLSYNIQLTNQANAATTKTATAKVTGTYNEKILKVSTWSIDYILAVPSIINADLSDKNLQSIIDNRKLVYNNYQNIPDSYKNTWYTMTWWFNFAPPSNNIVVLSWSLTDLTSSGIVQQQFITNLQTVYGWTIIQSEWQIKDIITATTPTQKQLLVWNYIDNHVWWITGTNTVVITWWRLLDSNCAIDDIVVWTQTWAWCNSTLWTWFERWKKSDGTNWTIWSCYNYDWATNIANCPIWATSMASNTSAITFFNTMQPDWTNVNLDAEVNNIWWKLYTWVNASGACINWRHLPSDANWETLETTLNWWTNCRNATDWWLCDWLGWKSNVSYNPDRKLAETLKIPLAGNRFTDGITFYNRGYTAYLWSSTPLSTNAYLRFLNRSNSTVYRYYGSQLYGFSVRCIKD
jgi:prepilin-type N-terminal cleavage/methylation domain-containing protein